MLRIGAGYQHMAIELDEPMTADLNGILHSASQMLNEIHTAYHGEQIQPAHVSALLCLRDDMGMLLASFEDDDAYGAIDDETRGTLRRFEYLACNLLNAIDRQGAPQ